MSSQTLYQRVLGEDFARLPPVLQRFHSLTGRGCATGTVAVEHGAGVLRHSAATILRLPYEGQKVRLRLEVIPQGSSELWIRHFDHQRLETLQWQEGPYLVEKAGPLCLAFQLVADADGLTFRLRHSQARGIRLARGLPMLVHAQARGAEEHWRIAVTISVPLLGEVTTYRGEVFPQPC